MDCVIAGEQSLTRDTVYSRRSRPQQRQSGMSYDEEDRYYDYMPDDRRPSTLSGIVGKLVHGRDIVFSVPTIFWDPNKCFG